MGDLIEAVLHPGREAGIDQVREVLLQQGRDGKGRKAGGERIVQEGGVAPIHDRADDGGVGGRATDALLFQHLHQRRLAVAGRGLGLVAKGLHPLAAGAVPHLQGRQQHLLALQGGIGIVAAFHVGTEEAGEVNALARGAEAGVTAVELHRHHGQAGIGHLAGHGALPDQLIEGQVLAIEARVLGGAEAFAGGADRLVGLLGVAGLGGELAGRRAEELLAVFLVDTAAGRRDRLVGEVHRVGAHVGDEAALVEALGRAHGLPGREPQFAVRLLLQGAGGEGGHGLAHRRFFLHLGHPPGGCLDGRLQAAGLGLAQ